jgi:hypothetical protein
MEKHIPGADSTKPHKDGKIKKHIYSGLQGVIKCLEPKPVTMVRVINGLTRKRYRSCDLLPSKSISSNKAGQNIVAPNHATRAGDEKLF